MATCNVAACNCGAKQMRGHTQYICTREYMFVYKIVAYLFVCGGTFIACPLSCHGSPAWLRLLSNAVDK